MRNLLILIPVLAAAAARGPAQPPPPPASQSGIEIADPQASDPSTWSWGPTLPGFVERAAIKVNGVTPGAYVLLFVHAELATDDPARQSQVQWYRTWYPCLSTVSRSGPDLLAAGVAAQVNAAAAAGIASRPAGSIRILPSLVAGEVAEIFGYGLGKLRRDRVKAYGAPVFAGNPGELVWTPQLPWWGGGQPSWLRVDGNATNRRWSMTLHPLNPATPHAMWLPGLARRCIADQMTAAGPVFGDPVFIQRMQQAMLSLDAVLTFQAVVVQSNVGRPITTDIVSTRGLDHLGLPPAPGAPPDLIITEPISVSVRLSAPSTGPGILDIALPPPFAMAVGGAPGQVLRVPLDSVPAGLLAFFFTGSTTTPYTPGIPVSPSPYIPWMGEVVVPLEAALGQIIFGVPGPPHVFISPPAPYNFHLNGSDGLIFVPLSGPPPFPPPPLP